MHGTGVITIINFLHIIDKKIMLLLALILIFLADKNKDNIKITRHASLSIPSPQTAIVFNNLTNHLSSCSNDCGCRRTMVTRFMEARKEMELARYSTSRYYRIGSGMPIAAAPLPTAGGKLAWRRR
jgi:hypothetical protein